MPYRYHRRRPAVTSPPVASIAALPFCPHCGPSHADDAGFCPACGLPIGGVITPAPRYAGFWIRFLPWVIDSLLIVVPLGALYSFATTLVVRRGS
jgi:hypothetical protein